MGADLVQRSAAPPRVVDAERLHRWLQSLVAVCVSVEAGVAARPVDQTVVSGGGRDHTDLESKNCTPSADRRRTLDTSKVCHAQRAIHGPLRMVASGRQWHT